MDRRRAPISGRRGYALPGDPAARSPARGRSMRERVGVLAAARVAEHAGAPV